MRTITNIVLMKKNKQLQLKRLFRVIKGITSFLSPKSRVLIENSSSIATAVPLLQVNCEMKSCNDEMMMTFRVFDLYKTFICFRGVINLSFYRGKKVQNIFLWV